MTSFTSIGRVLAGCLVAAAALLLQPLSAEETPVAEPSEPAEAVAAVASPAAPASQFYTYFLRAPRPTFETDATAEESARVAEHFQYLVQLHKEGVVLLAGRAQELVFPGIVIFKADSPEAARAIMENDPAVKAGVFRAEFNSYRFPLSRFVEKGAAPPISNVPAVEGDLMLRKSVLVSAAPAAVFKSLTDQAELATWFGAGAKAELRIGGPYEIYFSMDAPEGERGSEGCKVLSFIPNEMLCFEWNAPPKFPNLRGKNTRVVITLEEVAPGSTLVKLTHLGFGVEPEWADVHAYFDAAWSYVLGNLAAHHAPKQPAP